MLFGWTGHIFSKTDANPYLVLLYAIIAGFVMMFLIALSITLLMMLEADGTLDFKDSIEKEGKVYLKVPMVGQGRGKVQIIVSGSLRTLDAISEDSAIETGKKVKVIRIENDLLVVEEITD